MVASLARRFGDLDVAEEAAGEAFLAAVQHWGEEPPPNPVGWLMTTATRRALDRVRRDANLARKYEQAVMIGTATTVDATAPGETAPAGAVEDDRLRLIFTCCHPALGPEAQVALTLRLIGGLTVEQIARGLLQSEAAVGQRITRAKAKIAAAHIPFRVPESADLPERLDAVLSVLYLIFNEGYLPGGEQELRPDLTLEAIRLARLLAGLLAEPPAGPGGGYGAFPPKMGENVQTLATPAGGGEGSMPETAQNPHRRLTPAAEATGLLALMLLIEARRASRISADGELVTLAEQDRGGWDRALIAEGHALVRGLIATGEPPGRYQLQAAINAVHTYAPDIRDTDWAQLGTLYDQLFALDPNPVVALNRAVVRAELDGPAVALSEVDRLQLTGYHAWHVTRADLLRRLGRSAQAREAYDAAISLAVNPAEIRHLQRRRASLAA